MKEVVWRCCCPVALKTICVAGARGIVVHVVSVLLSEMVRPNVSKTSTKTIIYYLLIYILGLRWRSTERTLSCPRFFLLRPEALPCGVCFSSSPLFRAPLSSCMSLAYRPWALLMVLCAMRRSCWTVGSYDCGRCLLVGIACVWQSGPVILVTLVIAFIVVVQYAIRGGPVKGCV